MALRLKNRSRSMGMTLIELMVVVAVMVVLLVATIGKLQPLLADREVREAARQVNAFLASAQSRAALLDRPVGVWIERMPENPSAALTLFLAETPPPYSGDTISSVALVSVTPGNPIGTVNFPNDSTYATLINDGDLIRFNFRGPFYTLSSSSGAITFSHASLGPPPNSGPQGVPYQIFRRPVKSSVAPTKLPGSTVIDLAASGVGIGGTFALQDPANASPRPIIITFLPGGQVQFVYEGDPNSPNMTHYSPVGSIYLLVGRADRLTADNTVATNNLRDFASRWVSVTPQTGRVTTSLNAGDADGNGSVTLVEARAYAQDKQRLGGQ